VNADRAIVRKCSQCWRRFGKLRDIHGRCDCRPCCPTGCPGFASATEWPQRWRSSFWASVLGKSIGALRARKSERKRRAYGRTKPGSLLKHHIPVKTDCWDVTSPGFSEIDLVAHCGNSGEGELAHTLNLTDIHSGWTESRALLWKSQAAVQQALDEIEGVLPFRLLGVDSNNVSEFINWHLKR